MEALRSPSDAEEAIALATCPLADKAGNQISKYGMIAKHLHVKLPYAAAERAVCVEFTAARVVVHSVRGYASIPLPNRQQCRKMNFPFLARRWQISIRWWCSQRWSKLTASPKRHAASRCRYRRLAVG